MVVAGASGEQGSSRPSLAGSWGQEALKNYNNLNGTTIGRSRNSEHMQTVASSTFTADVFQKSRDVCPTKHHRFVSPNLLFFTLFFVLLIIASYPLIESIAAKWFSCRRQLLRACGSTWLHYT